MTLEPTKVKIINFFVIFDPNWAKIWPFCPSNIAFPDIVALNLH